MIQLMHHFGNDSRFSHSEKARRKKWFIKARQEQKLREDIAEEASENATVTAIGVSVIMASEIQIAKFEAKLDVYDTAITEALMDNRERLDFIEKRLAETELRLQAMLEQAYIIEDGRRVFKSEDGSFVIDEFGEDVSPVEVDFDLVTGPTAQAYLEQLQFRRNDLETRDSLIADRRQLHKAHDLVQEKREVIKSGAVTVEDLKNYDAEIMDALPPSARKRIPGFDNADNAPAAKTAFTDNAAPSLPQKRALQYLQRPHLICKSEEQSYMKTPPSQVFIKKPPCG